MPPRHSRRGFLQVAGMAAMARRWVPPSPGNGAATGGHPVPRPGVTARKVLASAELDTTPEIAEVFDQIREIPAILDGIRCQCDCPDLEGYYSLLTCYEGPDAMARHCEICQSEGRLVSRLHRGGRTLDQIRKAIDARFG